MDYVTKDLDHPDFPHRTEKGYFRGCHRDCCVHAHSRETKRRNMLRLRGEAILVPAEPVREHLRRLIDADPHFSAYTVANASGFDYRMVYELLHGETQQVRVRNAEALLALTVDSLRPHTYRVPAEWARAQVRGMMAQGWPGSLICLRLGYKSGRSRMPVFMYSQDNVSRELYERVLALAEEIGNSEGPSPITAKRSANRGWYPLAAYDERGNLNLRNLPGHPWAEADDMVGRLLDSLEWWATHPDATPYEVSQRMDRDQIEVTRLSDRLKRHHGARWHEALAAAVQAYEDGEDGTYVALSTGLVITGNVASTQVPKDHPVVARVAEERAAPRAAEAS